MFIDTGHHHGGRVVDTESVARATSIAGPYELNYCLHSFVPKESPSQRSRGSDPRQPRDIWGLLLMALTFGTLLSSQGADAHLNQSIRRVSGQPTKLYSSGSRPSTKVVDPSSAAPATSERRPQDGHCVPRWASALPNRCDGLHAGR